MRDDLFQGIRKGNKDACVCTNTEVLSLSKLCSYVVNTMTSILKLLNNSKRQLSSYVLDGIKWFTGSNALERFEK